MADCLHQVSFTNPDSTPDKKRIVGESGVFDYALSGGVSKIITIAND